MIKVIALNNGLEIRQTAKSPLVYLDIWSYDSFIENKQYGELFINALRSTGGTLCISLMVIAELSKRTDKLQINQICDFIDCCNTFVIDMNSSRVIRKEKMKNLDGEEIISDADLLKTLGSFCYHPTTKFSITSLIKEISEKMDRPIKTNFSGVLNPLITAARNSNKLFEDAKRRYKKRILRTGPPYTEAIQRKCFDFIAANKTMNMPESEWVDVFHLTVPVSYCNYVLLDNRWSSFVKNLDIVSPDIAKVYCKKQMEDFLNDLSGYRE